VGSGCDKSSSEKDVPLPAGLVQFKDEVSKAGADGDAVVAQLEKLVTTTSGDLKGSYDTLQAAVAAWDTSRGKVFARIQAMQDEGAAYFKAWEKQLAALSTPGLKEKAEARQAELAEKYAALQADIKTTKDLSDKTYGLVKDIEKILSNDLNEAGVKAIAPLVVKVKDSRKPVKENIEAILGEIGEIAAVYSRP
jgi:hypothetical protein